MVRDFGQGHGELPTTKNLGSVKVMAAVTSPPPITSLQEGRIAPVAFLQDNETLVEAGDGLLGTPGWQQTAFLMGPKVVASAV